MKNLALATIFTTQIGFAATSVDITIQSSYAWNKELWGTYNQIDEKFYISMNGKRAKRILNKRPRDKAILKNGHIFIVKSVPKTDHTAYKVKAFKYKKYSKKKLNVDLSHENFMDIYGHEINKQLTNIKEARSLVNKKDHTIVISDMRCNKSSSKMICSTNINISQNSLLSSNIK